MGSSTDMLKSMADSMGSTVNPREMDSLLSTGEQQTTALLAIALGSLGIKAVSFTGFQCGFVTTRHHTKARIKRIECERVRRVLEEGAVPVVAGFQGIDEDGNITTLGRGGSDTTAVALAAALGWDCEIYTDVDGIFAADPRKVPNARRLSRISYDEMMELSSLGSGVLETRSVELAKKYGVRLFLGRSLEKDKGKGTYIMDTDYFENIPVTGISTAENSSTLSAYGSADSAWVSRMFEIIADFDISVDTIAMQGQADGSHIVTFCCKAESARILMEKVREETLPVTLIESSGMSRISLVGAGMINRSGVAAKAFTLLSKAGIVFYHITTSEMAISLTVNSADRESAVKILTEGFDLCE
jgi:aspartate kinase